MFHQIFRYIHCKMHHYITKKEMTWSMKNYNTYFIIYLIVVKEPFILNYTWIVLSNSCINIMKM